MPITQITPRSQIDAMMAASIKKREQALLYQFAYIGESVVNLARTSRGYTDRTGNLVSSTGYVLVKDGEVVGTPYFAAMKNGESGKNQGREFAARKAAELIPAGIGIVVVAGMDYATHVEARGQNVLKLSEIEAKKMVDQLFNDLKARK